MHAYEKFSYVFMEFWLFITKSKKFLLPKAKPQSIVLPNHALNRLHGNIRTPLSFK